MEDSELESLMGGFVSSAAQYVDLELTPERAKATEYYKSKPFGNEEPGRSQFIVSEVHDGVQAVIPPIMRVVFSDAERVVEYRPRNEGAVAQAEQATDYVQYIFSEENNGFLKTLSVLKDGLIRKHGIFKWAWDAGEDQSSNHTIEGATQEQLELLGAEEGLEFTLVTPLAAAPGAPPTFDAEYTRTEKNGRVCIYEVPPEELIVNREARSLEDFLFLGHRTRKTTGELLTMGLSQKDIDICLAFDLSPLVGHANLAQIHELHESLRSTYSDSENEVATQ